MRVARACSACGTSLWRGAFAHSPGVSKCEPVSASAYSMGSERDQERDRIGRCARQRAGIHAHPKARCRSSLHKGRWDSEPWFISWGCERPEPGDSGLSNPRDQSQVAIWLCYQSRDVVPSLGIGSVSESCLFALQRRCVARRFAGSSARCGYRLSGSRWSTWKLLG